ncbi:ketosamine-3-kinase isoform X4 [Mobula hypostoma]|uniref:ketosamine-3-kinase isoform X4 n=1 Tax=Mobula hypostoma TaxID=723540 RepID=UPI002FC322A5
MENVLKRELNTARLKGFGYAGGGCISQGQSYETDSGRVFVKVNHKSQAKKMFDGEMASLEAILKTNTVKVPQPIKVISLSDGGSMFVMEHLDIHSLNRYMAKLGEQLADLHLHNAKLNEQQQRDAQTVGKGPGQSDIQYVDKFGFHIVTCCGYIPQNNDWQNDWVNFFTQQRLQIQMDLIEKDYGDREARELWSKLQKGVPLTATARIFCFLENTSTRLKTRRRLVMEMLIDCPVYSWKRKYLKNLRKRTLVSMHSP